MRAAVLRAYGSAPEVGEFDDPSAGDGQAVVEMLAAGLNPVDLRRASGSFYGGSPPLPSVAGSEGVGRLEDGSIVYFGSAVEPFGSYAERALIDPEVTYPVPEELDPALAVALGIAGLAAWLSLEWRAELREGETVLVLGASGVVGLLAVQVARLLGARWVVAAARSSDGLRRAVEHGADATVELGDRSVEELSSAMRELAGGGVDVVVDPLWGEPGAAAIGALNPRGRLVQLGESAAASTDLSSAAIRGRNAAILGHTSMLTPREVKREAYTRMCEHAAAGRLDCEVERVALDDAPAAWGRQAGSPNRKLVIVP